jgi:hypothetical protein
MAGRPAKRSEATIDPALARQLDAAHESGEPVEAVVMLQGFDRGPLASTSAHDIAESLMKRVEQEAGASPDAVNVLANLGAVVVVANEAFVRTLLDQPEVASAVANGPDAK